MLTCFDYFFFEVADVEFSWICLVLQIFVLFYFFCSSEFNLFVILSFFRYHICSSNVSLIMNFSPDRCVMFQ
jgi:hypothetical protein